MRRKQKPHTNASRLRGIFVVMALVLVATIVATFLVGFRLLEIRDKVRRHHVIESELANTSSALHEAEAGQRGFLLTGESAYLDPYRNAVAGNARRLQGLRELAAAGQLPSETLSEIKDLAAKKLNDMQRSIDLFQSGRKEAALALANDDSGRELTESLNSRFSELRIFQDKAGAKAETDAAVATELRTLMFLLTALINLGFLAWAYLRLRRETFQQYAAALDTERQREILQVTLSSIGDAVIITDTLGRITFINKVAEDLTGWNAAQAQGQPCAKIFRIIHEVTREAVANPVDKVLASGEIVGLAHYTILLRKDGSEVPIDDSGAPIRETDGTMRGVVLVFRDFTAHKENERSIIFAKQQVEDASKAKDIFLATLSHELRTPLTPVLATLSSWETKKLLPAALRPDLDLIRRNVEMEARLIDDLLDLTRIEHNKLFLEKIPVEAHGLIDAVLNLLKPESTAEGVEMVFFPLASDSFVQADPARLQQVFWNIIGNAVKFTVRGQRIAVSTQNLPGGDLEITVKDTGAGMSPESVAGLFRSFQQGSPAPNRKHQGLGLGLSIAKALVESHEGTLRAFSEGVGLGSTFTITIPTVTTPRGSSPSPAEAQGALPGRRILLLEDHEDTSLVLRKIITGMGHTVEACSSIKDAMAHIISEKYDLILSDLGLPDGTGIDFIRSARETCQTPAVALTGYGMREDVEDCLAAGFDQHLTKPVDFEKLQTVLRSATRRRSQTHAGETA